MKLKTKLKSAAKHKPVLLLLYALIFSTLGYIIVRSFAATPPTTVPAMYVTPSAQTLPINTTFTVAVRENSGTTSVNAVQANLSYPASLIDFVSIDSTTSAFPTEAQATGGAGTINIARGNSTAQTGDQLIANVTFRTKTVNGAAAVAFTSGTALVNSTTNTDILTSLANNTFGSTYTIDAQGPVVSITSPANGATISRGGNTTVSVSATDNSSVSGVEIMIDGISKTTLTTAPYTYSWATTTLALGSHTIQAKATDPYGNSTLSAISTVTLADQTAPTVTITAPLANATVTGTASIVATATDNIGGTGVSKVEFYSDNVIIGTITSATSTFTLTWDSKTATDGTHSITAKAYDGATPINVGTSAAVSVKVDNADHTPPTAPTALTATPALTSVTLNWTGSTDNVAVTSYRIQRNGTTVATMPQGTGTTYIFQDSGLASGTTYNYSVVALDAAGNASTAATVSATTFPLIVGDLNGDGHVNVYDLSQFLTQWNTTNPTTDFNHDGTTGILDLSILLSHWG